MNNRILALVTLCICGGIVSVIYAGTEEVKMDTTPNKTLKKEYDFVMDQKKQTEFLQKLVLIKIGEKRLDIISRLGPPTYDQVGARKEEGKFIVRTIRYYIKRWDKGSFNEIHDRSVELLFNQEDHLIWAWSNVEGYRIDNPLGTASAGISIGKLMEESKQRK